MSVPDDVVAFVEACQQHAVEVDGPDAVVDPHQADGVLLEGVGVPSRFFGVFRDGRLKARGLAYRHRDTPIYMKESQLAFLRILSSARDLEEYQELLDEVREELESRRQELLSGNVPPHRLLLNRRLSREVAAYKADTWTALAAAQYNLARIRLHPGQEIAFLWKNVKDALKGERVRAAPFLQPDDTYDAEKYVELLDRAAQELWAALEPEAAWLLSNPPCPSRQIRLFGLASSRPGRAV